MPSSFTPPPKWVEVTIKACGVSFDGAFEPNTDAVHVRLKSITDHLQLDYENQYWKVTSDPSYSRGVHVHRGLEHLGPGEINGRDRSEAWRRKYLYLPLDHVKQYLSGLQASRIRKSEGRAKLLAFQSSLVIAMERGYKKHYENPRSEGNPELTVLESLIRRHFDQAVAMVGRINAERRRDEERVQNEKEQREQQEREEKRKREEDARRRAHSGSTPDWREVLGVTLTTPWAEVQRRYRKLSLDHHPDRGGNHATMVSINLAYARARAELENR